MSLSDSLVYQPKQSAVSSSKVRWNQSSYNKSSFKPGGVVMINIPTGRRGTLLNTRMSYLKFKVTNNGTDAGHTIAMNFNIALFYQGSSYTMVLIFWNRFRSMECSRIFGTIIAEILQRSQPRANFLRVKAQTEHPRRGKTIAGARGSRIFCILPISGIVGVLKSK